MARISELLEHGRTFSFEFMPPRNAERETQLEQTLKELEPLRPSFVSITYGAGGSTRERTHSIVKGLLDTTMNPMAHLTCAADSRQQLVEIVTKYKNDGLENILALRGDPPLDSDGDLPPGELQRATELIELIHDIGDFCVAVASHPDGHPKAPDRKTDRKHQAAKLAVADFAITQFFFEAESYFQLVEEIGALGVETPIIPGLMPPSNVAQLTRMAELSGAEVPHWVHERLTDAGSDTEKVRLVGVEIVTELARELLAGGAPGLHIYTMNRPEAARALHDNLGLAPRSHQA